MRWCPLLLIAIALPLTAAAEPLDLEDPTARWIQVRFEISPRDRPAQAATRYTAPVPAWIEPLGDGALRRVVVDREWVERVLMEDWEPVAGSFDDFVWIFDSTTGDVVHAALSGVVRVELDMGLFRSTVEAAIETELATRTVGGFRKPRSWLGQQLFYYCDDARAASCTVVPTTTYLPESGYVNAVGAMRVRFGEIRLQTFSPLGEALFSELEGPEFASAPRPESAIRSGIGGAIPSPGVASMPPVSAGPSSLY